MVLRVLTLDSEWVCRKSAIQSLDKYFEGPTGIIGVLVSDLLEYKTVCASVLVDMPSQPSDIANSVFAGKQPFATGISCRVEFLRCAVFPVRFEVLSRREGPARVPVAGIFRFSPVES
jgi:hypothetical protein